MTRRSDYIATDRLSPDHLPACPDCGDLAHPTATVCDGCGQRLFPGGTAAFICRNPEGDWIEDMRKAMTDG